MSKYVSVDHGGVAFLRVHLPDLYHDFPIMAHRALELWGDKMDSEDRDGISYCVEQCDLHYPISPEHLTRVYVTTDYAKPHLILVDTPQNVLHHMLLCFDRDLYREQRLNEYMDCVVLWVFQGKKLTTFLPINPGGLADLLTAFYPDNLIARDHLRMNWNLQLKSWTAP